MKGLEYFPLNCYMNDSVRLYEAETGLEGYAILIKLWQSIYSGEGYFKVFDSDVCLLFAKEISKAPDYVIDKAIEREIFSGELYEKYKILTSEGVQRRFFKCVERRKEVLVSGEYLLISPDEFSNISVNISGENVNNGKQSKVKKSKVKKSKGEKTPPTPENEEELFGEYKNVRLTKEQYKALSDKLGEARLKNYIEKVSEYVQLSGKCYKDFSLVIKRWAREDEKKTSDKPKPSKFVNYTDTNHHDYSDFTERILKEMLDEEN